MKLQYLMAAALMCCLPACSGDDNSDTPAAPDPTPDTPATPDLTPGFDAVITPWDGRTAADADKASAYGTDTSIYWERTFTGDKCVTVTFDGATATVDAGTTQAKTVVSGAYVVLDLQSADLSGVKVTLRGSTADGGIKIYASRKVMLELDGADIASLTGPAVNFQGKKTLFVNCPAGTVNRLADAATYTPDISYLGSGTVDTEDRKGCLFAEGPIVFSGAGTLQVQGYHNHGVATDNALVMRPGATLAVTHAANNGVQVKGDADDARGLLMLGGLLWVDTDAPAGKAVKTDLNVDMRAGELMLNTSGTGLYVTDDADTSSAACIKADGWVRLAAGTVTLKSTGAGGKGINATGAVTIAGADVTAATSGPRFTHSGTLTSSPKALKTLASLTLSAGSLRVATLGSAEGAEGIDAKGGVSITGGDLFAYSYDDALKAGGDMAVTGGRVYAYSVSADGIDAKGALSVSGGLVAGIGGPDGSGIDADDASRFVITGGSVAALGAADSPFAHTSTQGVVTLSGYNAAAGTTLTLGRDGDTSVLIALTLPRTLADSRLMLSSPGLTAGAPYVLATGGSPAGATPWHGICLDTPWQGQTPFRTFTPASLFTTL